MPRLGAAWVRPLSVDPTDLVNRDRKRDELLAILEDYRNTAIEAKESSARNARILISGARGVGKSILTRRVLLDFAQKHPHQIIPVTIDSRSLPYRAVLADLAKELVAKVRPEAEAHRPALLPLLDHVLLLASHNQIQRSQTDAIQDKYAVQGGVGAEALLKLTSSFTWEQTRQSGSGTLMTVTVTESLLHSAINALLGDLAQSPWMVVIFYDDLDQALVGGDGDEILSVFRRVLDLGPCIALVHVRTDCCVENLRREIELNVEIDGMNPSELKELLKRRLQRAPREVQDQLSREENWHAIDQLASLTDNALVYLRWINGLLRTQDAPPPSGWATEAGLQAIVGTAAPVQGFDRRVLGDVVAAIDAQPNARWFTREGLVAKAQDRFTLQDIEDLEKLTCLLPRYRFKREGELYLEPVFNLLRPSLRAKLQD